MRVLHLIARVGLGGSERVAQLIAEGLAGREFESALLPIVGVTDANIGRQMRHDLVAHGIDLLPGSARRVAKPAILDAPRWLPARVREFRPDIVHLHTEIPELAWSLASLIPGGWSDVRLVRTIHNTVLWGRWEWLGGHVERRLSGAAVVAVGDDAASAFVAWRHRIGRPVPGPTVIRTGVECRRPASEALARPPSGRLRLCFAGRFELQKGIDVLLDALAMLDSDASTFEVDIVGGGRLEPLVVQRVAGFRRRVVVRPPEPGLRERLPDYDAVLMPSRFEGVPLLAIESLCAGVPILGTDAIGLREAIPPFYPAPAVAGDPAGYADLIRAFASGPGRWRAAAERARAWVAEHYSSSRMLDGYAALYGAVGASVRHSE